MDKNSYRDIDEYIQAFPPHIQDILYKIRQTIRKAAPEATEAISYQMPTFRLNGNLVHFAAHKNHIGFYPPLPEPRLSRQNWHNIKAARVLSVSPWTNPYPMTLSKKSSPSA